MSKSTSTYFKPSVGAAVVIANMIGTGVFTSLGFQLLDIKTGFSLLALWVIGGITALCGALSYAELGAALPRSGGEYNFLSKIYHPSLGFISGWISTTIGFAAPTALAAITFATYLSAVIPTLNISFIACILVSLLTAAHSFNRASSSNVQRLFTLLKIICILLFCALLLLSPGAIATSTLESLSFVPTIEDFPTIFSGSFAVALIYVNYAYTGWNAATYLTNEIESPQRNLPRILLLSTGGVMLLYLLLNFAFLYSTPIELMVGKLEIGFEVATHNFGVTGGKVTGVVLALLLISTASAMILAGPRVLQVIGQDFRSLAFFSRTNKNGIPIVAIIFQSVLTLIFIVTSTFQTILIFSGVTLAINTVFTVAGVFVLRWRQPKLYRPYKVWLFPWPPLIYLTVTLWTLAYLAIHQPKEVWASLAIISSGAIFYFVAQKYGKTKTGIQN